MTIGPAPVCLECAHWWDDRPKGQKWGFGCDAFPEGAGIPDSIIVEGNDHTRPVEGDHGIRFEAKKKAQ